MKYLNHLGETDFNPRYVEVSFSNTCNFKCGYCGPQYFSQWVEEIKNMVSFYKTSTNYNQIDTLRDKG